MAARKVLAKYQMKQAVLDEVLIIKQGVHRFGQVFQPLFQIGLPDFWDSEGKLIPESLYNELMIRERGDHSKFEDMIKGLTGNVVIGKLRNDFELISLFKSIKESLPVITHGPLIELDVMLKEMMDVDVPNEAGWKYIQRLGNQILKLSSNG